MGFMLLLYMVGLHCLRGSREAIGGYLAGSGGRPQRPLECHGGHGRLRRGVPARDKRGLTNIRTLGRFACSQLRIRARDTLGAYQRRRVRSRLVPATQTNFAASSEEPLKCWYIALLAW